MDKRDHMVIWEQVCTTDPKLTKHVKQRGGFTAVDAQSQLKRATEIFGPYGRAWGMQKEVWDVKELGTSKEGDVIWWIMLDAEFYYPNGQFRITVDMPLKPNDDCCKKLRTELRSKALSTLGFNSDVYEGRFDDMKYVAQTKEAMERYDMLERWKTSARSKTTKETQQKMLDSLTKLVSEGKWTEEEQKEIIDCLPQLPDTRGKDE